MDRRRAGTARPASSEEVECWSHAAKALSSLSTLYSTNTSSDTVGRVNRLSSVWPMDEVIPPRGLDEVKVIYRKLISGLEEIQQSSDRETKAIDDTIERLDVLIGFAQGAGNIRQADQATQTAFSFLTCHLPARASVGPSAPPIPFVRDPKARREAYSAQLPLVPGRKVAFHQPSGKLSGPGGAKPVAAAASTLMETGENWILAVVVKCLSADKLKYEVQDPEPQEDGSPGLRYHTTMRAIIPLPDPSAPPSSPSHVSAYPEFSPGSTVMALYPDTSCFYRAEVIATPRQTGRSTPNSKHLYRLKFEDDEDQEHSVSADRVVEWPN
ncbi:SGF29 C-terminal domain-containing protein [Mycena indigotica]|uniref:SGF29 C-terminal domain-containing protein n=1 Tax=Mycena indigotica TaxID=2126181 RepID=A0A8H6SGB8_9AGAR|nr:SGF29 C-terminal domain-containing protein [Mycena indigotica]KAF7299038.1 SGF29 C-terminal domain-containing protein [Mycena indigotica]